MPKPKTAPAVRLAIVGSDSLLGRELRDLLSNQQLASQVDLVSESEEEERVISEQEGDPVLMSPLNREALSSARVVFLTGSADTSRRVAAMKPDATMIDLTGTLTGTLRAPGAEPERYLAPESRIISIAHPAAILVAMFLRRVSMDAKVLRSVIHVFEPASQRGRAAVEELQQQTVGLLSFKPLNTTVFGDQLSFNMLSRLGEEAAEPLERSEKRIRTDLETLLKLDRIAPMPSLRLIHPPVFHSYMVSAWVEFERLGEPDSALKLSPFELRSADESAPTNTGVAGQSGISVDQVVRDDESANAAWYWLAADNLRLTAENALLTAASILDQAARRVQ